MGKINSGILGPVSGKVAGIVGARWKSQPYIRAYVVPGASSTDLQVAQRARFAYVVAAAKCFVGRVLNPYYDKFLSKVSGFNRVCSVNIPKSPTYTPVNNFQITDGPLYPGSGFAADYDAISGTSGITWNTELGIDGSATDVAIAWARDRTTNKTWFGADATRTTAEIIIVCDKELVATDFDCGIFFAKKVGSLVTKISRNLSGTATAT